MIEVDLRELDPKEEEINTSAALIRGVASCMSAMGCDLRERGLDVYMTSTVPKGSGLSSSAAYEVLMGTMLNELVLGGALHGGGAGPDRPVRGEYVLRKALRSDGSDGLLRGRRGIY